MTFWQNQLNFAVWCATAGCGISYKDHSNYPNPFVPSVYTFHVYCTIRKVLHAMQCMLPQEAAWLAVDNQFNKSEYESLCNNFNVDKNTSCNSQDLSKVYTDKKWKIKNILIKDGK